MVRKGSTRSSAAISRRRCKQVGNQAVTWEDKKFEDWQKPLFRRVDDGTMRHALPPVDTSWSTWPRPGFASDMCQSSRCHCVVCLPVTLWKRAAKPAPALNSLAVDSKLSFPAGMLKIESSCDGTRLVGLGRSPGRHTQLPPTGQNLSLRLSAATSTCGARSLAASAGRAGLGLQSRQLWLVLATRVTRRRQVAVLDQALRPGGVEGGIFRSDRGQPVDVPVEH